MAVLSQQSPLVSVAVRAYNHERYIRQAIESVRAQTYKNLEIIVTNDASTDKTDEIIKQLAASDHRIVYINNARNLGRVKSDNIILARARGEFMARLDGDDYWTDQNKIEQQVNFLLGNTTYLMVGNFVENVDEAGQHLNYQTYQIVDEKIRRRLLSTNQFAASGVLFKTAAVKQLGYSEKYKYIDDLEVWLQLGRLGQFANLPFYWTAHRHTGLDAGETSRREQVKEVMDVITKYKKLYPNYLLAKVKLTLEYYAFCLPKPLIEIVRAGKGLIKWTSQPAI